MKKILYILILIFLSNCENKNNAFNKKSKIKIDTVFYKYKGFNNGMKLYLFSNEKFKYEYYSYGCTGGGENEKITGNYKRKDNELLLEPDSVNIKILDIFSHTEFKEYKLKYKDDSLRIKTKYDIIKWNNIEYLISSQKDIKFRTHNPVFLIDYDIDSITAKQNGYYEFAEYYNSGYEPKKHGRYLTQVIKEKDSTSEKFPINKIPKKWRNLFLENPISAKIIKIKKEQRIDEFDKEKYSVTIITLNKGSQDLVRIGTEFYDKKGEKYIKIIKVSKKESAGITNEEYKINELVKTNWK